MKEQAPKISKQQSGSDSGPSWTHKPDHSQSDFSYYQGHTQNPDNDNDIEKILHLYPQGLPRWHPQYINLKAAGLLPKVKSEEERQKDLQWMKEDAAKNLRENWGIFWDGESFHKVEDHSTAHPGETIQAKTQDGGISVSRPDDKEEIEADRMADRVMREEIPQEEEEKLHKKSSPNQLMAKSADSGVVLREVQRKEEEEEKDNGELTDSDKSYGGVIGTTIDFALRHTYVIRAGWKSLSYIPELLLQKVGKRAYALFAGLGFGIIIAALILAVTTIGGAAIGAIAGAPAGGVGAAPGAAAGAKIGFDVGLLLLEAIGLGALIGYVAATLVKIGIHYWNFIQVAWNSGGEEKKLDLAAHHAAEGVATHIAALLEALLTLGLMKGIAKLSSIVRNSRFGKWIGETKLMQWLKARMAQKKNGLSDEAEEHTDRKWIQKKLDEYLLNNEHPIGGSKAKWFNEALGFNKKNMNKLARQIIFDETKAIPTVLTEWRLQ